MSTTIQYQISRGDWLSEIANRFDVNMDELAKANGIENANLIEEGQTLEITINGDLPNVTVKSGDSLASIALDHGISESNLVALNPGLEVGGNIAAGQQLKVPQKTVIPQSPRSLLASASRFGNDSSSWAEKIRGEANEADQTQNTGVLEIDASEADQGPVEFDISGLESFAELKDYFESNVLNKDQRAEVLSKMLVVSCQSDENKELTFMQSMGWESMDTAQTRKAIEFVGEQTRGNGLEFFAIVKKSFRGISHEQQLEQRKTVLACLEQMPAESLTASQWLKFHNLTANFLPHEVAQKVDENIAYLKDNPHLEPGYQNPVTEPDGPSVS